MVDVNRFRKFLFCSVLTFMTITGIYGQSNANGIDRHLLKITYNGGAEIAFGASEATVLQKFGKPISNQLFLFEMKELQGKELIYSDLEFLFLDKKIFHFTLKTANSKLSLNGNIIKIGDPVSALANFFPNYQNFPCGNDGYCINLLINGKFDEGFVLIIVFDLNTNKITKIYTHES